jgi:hypothetical protein
VNKIVLKNLRVSRLFFAVLAGIFFISKIWAQEDQPNVENRFLFIFSTSADMKSRVTAMQTQMNQLLSGTMGGELHPGDTMGVWTLGKNVQAGQFPLLRWNPDTAATIAGAINKFIRKQRYIGTNNFRTLQPLLERVTESSPRLTVLIFCDGETEFNGTPYDGNINQVFQQQRAELKKERLPFVIVLRTQRGEFVGCSVNYSPGMVNLPPFPPWPQPQQPLPEPIKTNLPAPTTAPRALPLVIVGTRVETNWNAYYFAMTNVPAAPPNPAPVPQINPVAPSNVPPKIEPAITNVGVMPPLPETNLPMANIATRISNVVATPVMNSITSTNAIVSSENTDSNRKGTLALAAGFLIGAIALTVLFIFRSRHSDRSSLITRTINKK